MKKFIIETVLVVVIFAVICIGTTIGLLSAQSQEKTNSNQSSNESDKSLTEASKTHLQENQQTLNLKGLYDENDLIISSTKEEYNGIQLTIPYISGLKNKEIQQKINSEMKEEIYLKVQELGDEVEEVSFYGYEMANYSNIISIDVNIIMKHDYSKHVPLNYELLHGNRLTIEDVFIKNADIQSMIRKCIFRELVMNSDGIWNDGETISIDENQLYEQVTSFMKDEKSFYITSTYVCLIQKHGKYVYYDYDEETQTSSELEKIGEVVYHIPMADYADQITIYDKFKGDYDLYETDDIGSKNIYPCTQMGIDSYTKYGFEQDNLWVRLLIVPEKMGDNEEYFQREVEYRKILKNSFAKNEIERYKKIAKESPDSTFVAQKTYRITPVYSYDFEIGETKYTKILCISEVENITEITSKELQEGLTEELQQLLVKNSYYYDNIYLYWDKEEGIIRDDGMRNSYNIDINTFEGINHPEKLFHPKEAYQNILRNELRTDTKYDGETSYRITRTDEEIDRIISESRVYFDYGGIQIQNEKESIYKYIGLESFKDSFDYWLE